MSRYVLFVHGHHFKPAADVLQQHWDEAIQCGLRRDKPDSLERYQAANRAMAYYGDLSNGLLKDAGLRYDEQLDIEDQRNALSTLKERDKPKRFRRREYNELPGRSALKKNLTHVAAPLLHSLQLKDSVLAKVAPELPTYWRPDSAYARAVANRIEGALNSAFHSGDRVLVIAHGFGSVLVYDALWLLSHEASTNGERKVDHLLTLGSPLGDETVKRRLLGARQSGVGRYPTNIIRWDNVAATDDFVAHDHTLADDYKPMLKHRLISRINDYRVHNLSIRYGRSTPHSALGYLIHPRMIGLLNDWLLRD